ncbi:hypothetical protein AMTRI_Chr10g230300 [Amborella trichopoda]|uniref:uncharacterized protein LOC18427674 n=1 Tax=Amborella trichopoda TaxID=13333 RepID=UPI0009C0B78C|nr:uncharacterized protein LOC18427674 [Amborella trichopoda]|eukprot:XP_020518871.1 uncharacterized protein LOC18427674 [Amborella trichopoda]
MQEREFTQEKRGPLLSVCLKFFLECIGVLLSILVILIREYAVLKMDLAEMEHHILTEMGFKCHCEHPYDFILSYLNTLKTPHKVRQEAWNLANDGYNISRVWSSDTAYAQPYAFASKVKSLHVRLCILPLAGFGIPFQKIHHGGKSSIQGSHRLMKFAESVLSFILFPSQCTCLYTMMTFCVFLQ